MSSSGWLQYDCGAATATTATTARGIATTTAAATLSAAWLSPRRHSDEKSWWARRVGTLESSGVEPSGPEEQALLLQIPPSWPGNLNRLLRYLRRSLPTGSEVDGTLRGADGITVYLYGPDAERLADVVSRRASERGALAGVVMQVRPGPPGTEAQLRHL